MEFWKEIDMSGIRISVKFAEAFDKCQRPHKISFLTEEMTTRYSHSLPGSEYLEGEGDGVHSPLIVEKTMIFCLKAMRVNNRPFQKVENEIRGENELRVLKWKIDSVSIV